MASLSDCKGTGSGSADSYDCVNVGESAGVIEAHIPMLAVPERGGRGVAGRGGPSRARTQNWELSETMVLIEQKRLEWEKKTSKSPNQEHSKKGKAAWEEIAKHLNEVCGFRQRHRKMVMGRWDVLTREFKKLKQYGNSSETANYWLLDRDQRRELKLPVDFSRTVYDALNSWYGVRLIHGEGMDMGDALPLEMQPQGLDEAPGYHGPPANGPTTPTFTPTVLMLDDGNGSPSAGQKILGQSKNSDGDRVPVSSGRKRKMISTSNQEVVNILDKQERSEIVFREKMSSHLERAISQERVRLEYEKNRDQKQADQLKEMTGAMKMMANEIGGLVMKVLPYLQSPTPVHNSISIDACQVTLRSFTPADVADFMEWAADDEVTRTLVWDTYHSQEEALEFLTSVAIPHPWFKAICVDGTPIGSITLEKGDGGNSCRAQLGYAIAKKYWGRGVTTNAVKLALATGFQDLGVQRIEALVHQPNIASRRVLEKAGFQREALLRRYMVSKGHLGDYFLLSVLLPDNHSAFPTFP